MDALELAIHVENTAAYIAYKPSDIVLVPTERSNTAGGGYKDVDGTPRASQTFRIIEFGQNQTPPILTLTDGKQREAEFLLLGMPAAAIAVNDHWKAIDGREWLVADIVRDNLYEVRALVTERGK